MSLATRRIGRRPDSNDNDQEEVSLLETKNRKSEEDNDETVRLPASATVKASSTSREFCRRFHSVLLFSNSCCASCAFFLDPSGRCRYRLRLIVVCFLAISGLVAWLHFSYLHLERTWLNPIERITPFATSDNTIGDEDGKDGRFCEYKKHRWNCQECYWGKCKPLRQRHYKCPPFRRQDWDEPYPRSRSHLYDDIDHVTQDFVKVPFRLLTRFGISKAWRVEYEQPVCTVASCFNLTRCDTKFVTIYSKPPVPILLQRLIDDNSSNNKKSQRFQLVQDPYQACLVIVFPQQYESRNELVTTSSWGHGRNHFIWNAACYVLPSEVEGKDWFCDQPFSNIHYGLASLAHTQLTSTHVRNGYDVPLPLPRQWKRPIPLDQIPMSSQRPLLLSFRGGVQDTLQPYYQHRWLAAEYWDFDVQEHSDVVVNTQCVHRRRITMGRPKNQVLHGYDNDSPELSFAYLLLNSTFVFTPGGSGVNTYRFSEALSAGAIPVVTPDFVPPFSPELDWSPCLVVVSESRIVDLPRILRQEYQFHQNHRRDTRNTTAVSENSINRRQKACIDLLQASMGDKYDDKHGGWLHDDHVIFEQAVEIVRLRILHAKQYQDATTNEILHRQRSKNKKQS